ncbi:heme biosynthesis HemY N-terminal domain-containing protein [Pelistega europaea]|uniref:Heme biosynthesis protein HemY n=1 Tax=Pelistega europaea TaxID=106147 RepID=A0A7Y4L9S7_9BURK|nr:heme biosynthesis HemY N-terminal domain-containing protein [Pelistega europaea]NOL49630.1 heme biosynthesis protein HemY [Pelistega europaea]
MRAIIKLLILFGLAILAVFFLRNNTDVVMLITGDERRTMSLLTAILCLLVIFAVFYVVVRLIAKILSFPKAVSQWSDKRHTDKDILLLERGWIELLEGRSDKAEKNLLRLVDHTKDAKRQIVASLAAARAAHNLAHYDKRDALLKEARQKSQSTPQLEAAVATVQAELLLEQGNGQAALEHLAFVKTVDAKSTHVLQLFLRAYRQTGDTLKMFDVARQLLRKYALTQNEFHALVEHYGTIYMANASYQEATAFYQALSREEKAIADVALTIATRYDQLEEYRKSREALELALNRQLDSRLLAQYVKCPDSELNDRIHQVQQWLSVNENSAELLCVLGQLCLMAKLWGQAERYLTKSLHLQENAKVHALLGVLNDRQGRPQEAMQHWRLASGSSVITATDNSGVLAAADTSNDPEVPPDVKNLKKLDDHFLANKVETGRGIIDKKTDDEFFDSAPIPGIHANKE